MNRKEKRRLAKTRKDVYEMARKAQLTVPQYLTKRAVEAERAMALQRGTAAPGGGGPPPRGGAARRYVDDGWTSE